MIQAIEQFFKRLSQKKQEQWTDFLEYHQLNRDDSIEKVVTKNPHIIGISEEFLKEKSLEQQKDLILGEYYWRIARYTSELASKLLFKAQWGYQTPEWFDHRHHLLDIDRFFRDYWAIPATEVIKVLPWKGRLLELCSGDGFYPYYFYKTRASEIICVEFDREVYNHAVHYHSAPNIKYLLQNVLDYEPDENCFDVVSIRGAIEHFLEEEQLIIFQKAWKALKPEGYFCGETPAAKADSQQKHLVYHDREYQNETELKQHLGQVFNSVETYTVVSEDRTNLFWKCKK